MIRLTNNLDWVKISNKLLDLLSLRARLGRYSSSCLGRHNLSSLLLICSMPSTK